MKIKRWMVVLLFTFFLMNLFGCGKKHVLDGPGMLNDQPWRAFTVSRSDSSQYNFWFEVQKNELGFLLTGECRDEDGEMYVLQAEDGILLSTCRPHQDSPFLPWVRRSL